MSSNGVQRAIAVPDARNHRDTALCDVKGQRDFPNSEPDKVFRVDGSLRERSICQHQ